MKSFKFIFLLYPYIKFPILPPPKYIVIILMLFPTSFSCGLWWHHHDHTINYDIFESTLGFQFCWVNSSLSLYLSNAYFLLLVSSCIVTTLLQHEWHVFKYYIVSIWISVIISEHPWNHSYHQTYKYVNLLLPFCPFIVSILLFYDKNI